MGGGGDEILQIMKKARRLSVYGLTSAKSIDNEARAMALKALKLLKNFIALGDEDKDKKLAFSSKIVQRIQKTGYDDRVIREDSSERSSRGVSFLK